MKSAVWAILICKKNNNTKNTNENLGIINLRIITGICANYGSRLKYILVEILIEYLLHVKKNISIISYVFKWGLSKQIEGLVQKGYLIREKRGSLWLYSPKYSKRPVVIREVKNLIESIAGTNLSQTYMDLIVAKSFRSDEIKKVMDLIINLLLESHKSAEDNEQNDYHEET